MRWIRACESRHMHFADAPIASRVIPIAGAEESRKPIIMLMSSRSMLGEAKDDSLDPFCLKVFASPAMMAPMGRNNALPMVDGEHAERELAIYTDASKKDSSIGISALFIPDDEATYAYAGALLIDTQLDTRTDGLINGSETIACVTALLTAIEHGYRRIRILTDSKEIVRIWAGDQRPRRTMDKQFVTLRDMLTEQEDIRIAVDHVYGHRSDIMNIGADGIAQINTHMSRNGDGATTTGEGTKRTRKKSRSGTRISRGKQEKAQDEGGIAKAPQDPPKLGDEAPQPAEATTRPMSTDEARPQGDAPHDDNRQAPRTTTPTQPPAETPRQRRAAHYRAQSQIARHEPVPVTDAVAPLSQRATATCIRIGQVEPSVTPKRVAKHIESGGYLQWNKVVDDDRLANDIRILMCDSDAAVIEPEERIRIWTEIAPVIAKKLSDRKKQDINGVRALIIARICNVGITRCLNAVTSGH